LASTAWPANPICSPVRQCVLLDGESIVTSGGVPASIVTPAATTALALGGAARTAAASSHTITNLTDKP
jgi:hypothetical protein